MTETSTPKVPADLELVQVRHFEAGPPAGLELVEPGETFATTKEEEWVSKKKTELTTTRQIETRVKRQVVLEDGKVVEDSGPIVTTNTSEDTEKQEHSQTEVRKLGEDEPKATAAIEGGPKEDPAPVDWVAVPNPDGVVREVKERRIVSREETEELRETEDVHHLGDISDKDFLAAVHSGQPDLRLVLREKGTEANSSLVSSGPRIVHESIKSHKVTDTEDTAAVSSVRPDGKILTETTRTTQHEEVKDEDLPIDEPDSNTLVENSQRYQKTKDQELVEYLADGVKIGQEMRYQAETMEGERHGDGLEDPHDWDSLSTRIRRARRQQQPPVAGRVPVQKPRGAEEQVGPPLDRKDALTKKPLDFDEEEETRKTETSKWLEHHFGSESTRSSRDSIDEDEPAPPSSKSFFNVTIKSQPTRVEPVISRAPMSAAQRPYPSSPEPDRVVTPVRNGYFQGITEWSERKQQEDYDRYRAPVYNGNGLAPVDRTPHRGSPVQRQTLYRVRDDLEEAMPTPPERKRAFERRQRSSQDSNRYDSGYRTHSRNEMSRDSHDEPQDEPPPDYSPPPRHTPSPSPPVVIPVPPIASKKPYQRTRFAAETTTVPAKAKHGNIIGQSIRKLVGKIRSASAERKAKQRAKRSPSPQTTYQQYNVIDNIPGATRARCRDSPEVMMADARQQHQRRGHSPVQRYYLGEDPFGGSIYGRENKYDGVKPARSSGKHRAYKHHNSSTVTGGQPSEDESRSHSTLGRFSKSTSRLVSRDTVDYSRSAQTLPRNIRTEVSHQPTPTVAALTARTAKNNHSNSTINVSIINTVAPNRPIANGGPAKPARTYKSNLARSKSFNVHAGGQEKNMYKSNPHLHRLEENPIGLKSPGLISSISRSTRDLSEQGVDEQGRVEHGYTARYVKNGNDETKKVFMKSLKERAPELYKTLQSDDEEQVRKWSPPAAYSTPVKPSRYNHGDMYEPPTRLVANDSYLAPQPIHSTVRRGSSNSTDDYSETYHTTTRNDDPKRPSVTDTVKTFTKKTVPSKDGRKVETIQSSETKSITRSRFRGEPMTSMKIIIVTELGYIYEPHPLPQCKDSICKDY
ncbi:chascon [Carabus blaptoides fortunei]